jgi:hypothetical protein
VYFIEEEHLETGISKGRKDGRPRDVLAAAQGKIWGIGGLPPSAVESKTLADRSIREDNTIAAQIAAQL